MNLDIFHQPAPANKAFPKIRHGTVVSLIYYLHQWTFTCSKLTIETLEQGVKYVQS